VEWRKSIVEGYSVSEYGDVRNDKTGLILRQVCVRKRPYIGLRKKLYQVYRLVAWAFHGPKPHEGSHVCHIDGDANNNHYSNLYWGDKNTNGLDDRRNGSKRGVKNGRCRVTPDQVMEIVALGRTESDKKTAKRFGLGSATVSHIRTGKNWSHLTGIEREIIGTKKLCAAQVSEIKAALQQGKGVTELGREYGVTHNTIAKIRDGKTWKGAEAPNPTLPV
jgi:hypothetical protein